ncbi:MAG: hypothetical protein WDO19_22310 [Bacteroidota bacterium]
MSLPAQSQVVRCDLPALPACRHLFYPVDGNNRNAIDNPGGKNAVTEVIVKRAN